MMKDEIVEEISEAATERMYRKSKFLKHIPEIKKIENGQIKALRNDEIHKFLRGESNGR